VTDAWWIEWIPVRAFVILLVIYGLVSLVYLVLVNEEILGRRMVLKKGTETWDWVWFGVFSPLFLAIYGVAWLDIGSGRASLPLRVWPIGLVLFVLGGALFTRAMGENPFFEKTVRIQSERGHHVIDTGPYRVVRQRVRSRLIPAVW
jgi:protein-S-isoprenylcysteine O-methyltransferase Ste14